MYHFERTTKDTEGRTKKDAEDIERLKKENEELKVQVADLSYKYKSAQGYLQRHLWQAPPVAWQNILNFVCLFTDCLHSIVLYNNGRTSWNGNNKSQLEVWTGAIVVEK